MTIPPPALPPHFHFTRSARYRTIWRTLPYVLVHTTRKPFRATPYARSTTTSLTNKEFDRVVHDLYCDMFLRGYRQATGYPADRATGLVLVLFAVFIYAFDDEFEERRRRGDHATDTESILAAPGVAEVWQTLGNYLQAAGRSDEVREYIVTGFLGAGYDEYRRGVGAFPAEGSFSAVLRLVEFDSGQALHTAYQLIRLFNAQAYNADCAEEFRSLGLAGKFMDDMADYAQDVRRKSPNLLHCLVQENQEDLTAAQQALARGDLITTRWWAQHCPATYNRFLAQTATYYEQVRAPGLRLPLDVYLALLGTRKFWTISTVREPQRAQ